MSWDAWVSNLVQRPGVNIGAICDNSGNVWAKSENFEASPEELQAIAAGLGKPDAGGFQSFHLNGTKYMVLRLQDRELDARKGSSNITVMGCTQCIVIGGFIDTDESSASPMTGNGPKVNVAVADLKKNLAASGY